jgi:hypothetical protein
MFGRTVGRCDDELDRMGVRRGRRVLAGGGQQRPSTTRLRRHESNTLDDSLIRALEAQLPQARSALLVRSSQGHF